VSRVYSDLAIFDIANDAAVVVEMVDGLDIAELQRMTRLPLQTPNSVS
jgi:acyl CoA:acetate/3-ketoacid CoA transferase beta subunit